MPCNLKRRSSGITVILVNQSNESIILKSKDSKFNVLAFLENWKLTKVSQNRSVAF